MLKEKMLALAENKQNGLKEVTIIKDTNLGRFRGGNNVASAEGLYPPKKEYPVCANYLSPCYMFV